MNEMFRHWCIKCLENKQQFVSVDFAENKGLQTNQSFLCHFFNYFCCCCAALYMLIRGLYLCKIMKRKKKQLCACLHHSHNITQTKFVRHNVLFILHTFNFKHAHCSTRVAKCSRHVHKLLMKLLKRFLMVTFHMLYKIGHA